MDWASLIVGSKSTVFALFTLYLRVIFQVQAPGGAYIWRGDLTEGFLRYRIWGLIFGGAYTWRGLFAEFYNCFVKFKGWIANIFVFSYESHLSSVTGLFSRLRRRLIFNRPRPGP